jgi:hypothetical protein
MDIVAQATRATLPVSPSTVLVIAVLSSVLCAVLAAGKGRRAIGWGILGFLFGLIPLAILVFLRRKSSSSY